MPYITGGLALSQLHGQEGDVAANGAFGSGTTWVAGYAVGAGIESLILPRWTVKLEGMYTDFGKHTVFDDNIGGAIVPESIHFAPGWVKIGVNYKLW